MTTAPKHLSSLPADVARCRGLACKLKNDCRRFISYKHDLHTQVVSSFIPEEDGSCKFLIARE